MRILHVWRRPYPFDIRVQKISHTLSQAGHHVCILAANSGAQMPCQTIDGVEVRRLPALTGPLAPVSYVTGYAASWNPRWARALWRHVRALSPDVVLVRDLQLALICILQARRLGIPVVLDLAEHWPATLATWRATEPPGLQNLLMRNVAMCRFIERWAVHHADHVIVCVEEMRSRLIRMSLAPERVSLVRNTPDLALYPRLDDGQRARAARIRESLRSEFLVVYEGEINVFRGLTTLIRAMARLRTEVPTARLVLIGKGKPANERVIRGVCAEAGMGDGVTFAGWLEQPDMLDYVAAADVGAAPYYASECLEYTLGNKFFDYMSLGKPFVSTDIGPIRRLVNERDCGVICPPGDDAALASALSALTSPRERRRLGGNGLRAVREEYNWTLVDGPRVLEVLARVSRAGATSAVLEAHQ